MKYSTHNSDCRSVLALYGDPFRTAEVRVPECRGFSGAQLWQVETPRGLFCLRGTEAAFINRARALGLHRLLRHIAAQGVTCVPVSIATLQGETLPVAGGFAYQLEPWLPGVADFATHPTETRLHAAMFALARWHRAAENFVASSSERQWFFVENSAPSPGIRERLSEIARWDMATRDAVLRKLLDLNWSEFSILAKRVLDLFAANARAIADELTLARNIAVPLQPCLRDVWHDHVLFTGDEVTGLIDAHACRSDNVATDLARLLGSLVGDNRSAWDFALSAYQKIRPLSLAERGLIEVFDHSSVLLSAMTWLDWVCVQGREFSDRRRVCARLQSILRRLEKSS